MKNDAKFFQFLSRHFRAFEFSSGKGEEKREKGEKVTVSFVIHIPT